MSSQASSLILSSLSAQVSSGMPMVWNRPIRLARSAAYSPGEEIGTAGALGSIWIGET